MSERDIESCLTFTSTTVTIDSTDISEGNNFDTL